MFTCLLAHNAHFCDNLACNNRTLKDGHKTHQASAAPRPVQLPNPTPASRLDDQDCLFLGGVQLHLCCCNPEEQLQLVRIAREGCALRYAGLSSGLTHIVVRLPITASCDKTLLLIFAISVAAMACLDVTSCERSRSGQLTCVLHDPSVSSLCMLCFPGYMCMYVLELVYVLHAQPTAFNLAAFSQAGLRAALGLALACLVDLYNT